MLLAVLSVFVLAALAPLVARLGGRAAGWALGILPAALFGYFASKMPVVAAGQAVQESYAWVPGLGVSLSFYVDGLSLLFALLVTGIGALIVVYAGGYMEGHPQLGRFFAQLLFFMGAMLGLVVADNLLAFFVFFELTSLASYLLIGFYHEETDSRVAARQALIVTGGGGLALLGGLLLLQQVTGTLEISQMLGQGAAVQASALYPAILVLVLVGAFTKSAQFPFHFWLPAAMAGPTPVSAYLHSATMVKAGVFLLARLHPVLGGTTAWTATLVLFGGFTMVLTAWLALRYTDLKQILAYTTLMVLGLLTMLLGIGTEAAVKAAVVFTVVHALYKGALFMIAGNVDHEAGTREVLELGGLRDEMPLTAAGGLAAALSMAGLPPLFGFIGKEAVYEAALGAGAMSWGILVASLLANAALFASGLIVGVKPFFGKERGTLLLKPHEAPLGMWLGPGLLALLGLAFGLMPGLIDEGLLTPAVAAVLPGSEAVHLALWHGLTPALGLSLLTFALGGVLYAGWGRLRSSGLMTGLDILGGATARGFERALYEVVRASYGSTRLMQSGSMRAYLLTIFGFTTVLVGAYLAVGQMGVGWPAGVLEVRYYELALAVLIILAAAAAVRARSRFTAVLALSVAGYSIATLYLFFGAPDLAMTQFAIETLTIILLVLVLVELPRRSYAQGAAGNARDAVAAIGVGVVVTLIMVAVLQQPLPEYISRFMAENAYTEARGHNIVNVILVDYRGFDTLGEITVLAMAALGVYALMRLRPPEKQGVHAETPATEEPSPYLEIKPED